MLSRQKIGQHAMPAARQTHVDIMRKVPCKAMLQRLETMALNEPSALLLISRVASFEHLCTLCLVCAAYTCISQYIMYQNAVLLLQVCPQRREANVSFPSIVTSRPVAIAGGVLQLGWLQPVDCFKDDSCHGSVIEGNRLCKC